MELYLFSTPASEASPPVVVDACREVLKGKADARMACLPQGLLTAERWLREAQRQFRDLVQIDAIDTETMESAEMEAILRRAALVHIPDGNASLLNHRLQTGRIATHLRKKIQNGLPVVACGAGAVVCGPNILTAHDLNVVPTTHFDALGVTPFNIHVHYAEDAEGDDWLSAYHVFHDNPVLLLEDGTCIRISGKATTLQAGAGWVWRPGQEKAALKQGEPIPLNGAAR